MSSNSPNQSTPSFERARRRHHSMDSISFSMPEDATATLRRKRGKPRAALGPAGLVKTQPFRTTKASQKLVLLDPLKQKRIDIEKWQPEDGFDWPDVVTTDAERLPKGQRAHLPRVTAYCTAESYNMPKLRKHLSDWHNVQWKVYDECSWGKYDRKARQAMHDVHEGNTTGRGQAMIYQDFLEGDKLVTEPVDEGAEWEDAIEYENENPMLTTSPPPMVHPSQGDVFIFDFGVVVFWNFSLDDEERVLSTIAPFSNNVLKQDDIQIEDLHFQYDPNTDGEPSRIYNDLITLHSPHHLVKLTLSHGLAQSVKLARFESLMEETIEDTKTIPLQMARTGRVHLNRKEVLQVIGQLFKLRMDVNLVSNVLDTPELLWDRPELEPLYDAIQQYLELRSRSTLLNTRAGVVNDLMDLLNDHLSAHKMSNITWIIIWLIVLACIIAILEIFVKAKKAGKGKNP